MKIILSNKFAANTVLAAAFCGVSLSAANAALTQYSDRATFEAQGQLGQKYGFEAPWGPTGGTVCAMSPCSATYTTHGVTYAGDSVIVRPDSTYLNGRYHFTPESNVLGYQFFNTVNGTIVGQYNMFGFDLGNLVILNNGPVTYTLTTNLGTYTDTVPVPNVNDRPVSMKFLGFVAGPGEIFTQFSLTSNAAPVVDNVTLGNVTSGSDYGDAPNAAPGKATGNYNTLSSNNGPSHQLGQAVYLGSVAPDGDNGALQNASAQADDTTANDDEDGVPTLPWVLPTSTSVSMTVNATNLAGSPASLACWIDFNRDGDFLDAGERAATVAIPANTHTAPYALTFSGFSPPLVGITYVRCRIALNASEVQNPTGAALSGEVEDYALWVPGANQRDYGDAPDAGVGTGPGNYNTTLADNGPRHLLGQAVFLGGVAPDADSGSLQNSSATADNTTAVNDEDGVPTTQMPTIATTASSTKMKVTATNNTVNPGLVACWIDFNRNGVFDNGSGELATMPVAASSGTQTYGLTFTGYSTPLTAGQTYLRCRITTQWTAAAQATPVGEVSNGEVEDYALSIYPPCAASPITTVPASGSLLSGIRFTVFAGGTGLINNIASVQCQKTINIDPAAMTFSPAASSAPVGAPPTWSFSPVQSAVEITARRAALGTATLACTAEDSTGHVCSTDPVIVDVLRIKGQPVTVTVEGEDGTFSANDRYVKIINGSAGLTQLEISVNGTKFKQTAMRDDTDYRLDIGSALRILGENLVTVTAKGKPGGEATVLFSDSPNM
jgi:hypothetical protein